jgi:hypothetical protein
MRVYCGQTRGRRQIAALAAAGFGEVFVRGKSCWPPRRTPWLYDNGAYGDWQRGRSFDVAAFERDLPRIREAVAPPDFIACPDIVAGGRESLAFSLGWLGRLRSACPGLPVYLVVQDGMEVGDVPEGFDGLFVGGMPRWKAMTMASWAAEAHRRGQRCHVGKVGSMRAILLARHAGADSIDSNELIHDANREIALRALAHPQTGWPL